jgi:hypothetical protein
MFKFTQVVIRRVPWTTTKFRIVETYSKFEDDYLPKAVSVQMTCRKITSKTAEGSDCLRLFDDKNTGVDKMKLSLKRTDEIMNTKVYDKRINEKLQGKSKNRHGELKNADKNLTACSTQSSTKSVRKHTDGKMEKKNNGSTW